MNYYERCRERIASRITGWYPEMISRESDEDDLGNALWMMEQITKFGDQGKIDRWMGCVQGVVHTKRLFSWQELRDMTREDLRLNGGG